MAELLRKTYKNTFHVISGLNRYIPDFIFLPILTLQKVL